MKPSGVTEVTSGVYCATGTDVNWYLVRDGDSVTLIDSGYPGDTPALLASLDAIGARPHDVRAILLTHAHIDHIGGLNHFHREYGTPVYMSAIETAHARREYLQQATPVDVARNAWRPGVLPWSLRIIRAGATRNESVPHAAVFPSALDLPGGPVPIPTAGHTDGHTAYFLPSVGAVAIGDGIVTAHPTSRLSGPQPLPSMFNHCTGPEILSAMDPLAGLDAGVVLPGHGAPVEQPIGDVVAAARRSAADRRYW